VVTFQLFMKEGFDIHRRSSVRSFLVGLSMTCVRLWSFNISSKFWCRVGSGLLGTIKVITKLPNSEQSYKGKVKTHNYINRQNQSTTGKL
jgi:hypothetical protein